MKLKKVAINWQPFLVSKFWFKILIITVIISEKKIMLTNTNTNINLVNYIRENVNSLKL